MSHYDTESFLFLPHLPCELECGAMMALACLLPLIHWTILLNALDDVRSNSFESATRNISTNDLFSVSSLTNPMVE